jgi:type II secretion system protein I
VRSKNGFTLLEVLVATVIMGIAVAGVMSGLAASTRNAAKLTQYDRATLLARQKMDELLTDQTLHRGQYVEGVWDEATSGGIPAGWRAQLQAFETAPGSGPGQWIVDRVQLEVWWMDGQTRRAFSLEGYRRGIIQTGDVINVPH